MIFQVISIFETLTYSYFFWKKSLWPLPGVWIQAWLGGGARWSSPLFCKVGGKVIREGPGNREGHRVAVCPNAADEGVGILVVVALNNQLLLCVLSQLMKLTRALWLNPPTMGARIITSILCNPALQEEW